MGCLPGALRTRCGVSPRSRSVGVGRGHDRRNARVRASRAANRHSHAFAYAVARRHGRSCRPDRASGCAAGRRRDAAHRRCEPLGRRRAARGGARGRGAAPTSATSSIARAELERWLAIAGAGAVIAAAAWSVYVPASDHYSPTPLGTVNRINAPAAIGIAILLYSCLMLLARMLVRLLRLPAAAAGLLNAAATLALGAAYVRADGCRPARMGRGGGRPAPAAGRAARIAPAPAGRGEHLRLRRPAGCRPRHPGPQHDPRSDQRGAHLLLEPGARRHPGHCCGERRVWSTGTAGQRRGGPLWKVLFGGSRRATRSPPPRPRAVRAARSMAASHRF